MAETGPFTAMAVDSEMNLLRRLHGMIEKDEVATREQFLDLMKVAFVRAKLDARALSDELGYNFSTIHRWIDGRTAPHPSLWPRVTRWVADALKQRIDACRAGLAVEA